MYPKKRKKISAEKLYSKKLSISHNADIIMIYEHDHEDPHGSTETCTTKTKPQQKLIHFNRDAFGATNM